MNLFRSLLLIPLQAVRKGRVAACVSRLPETSSWSSADGGPEGRREEREKGRAEPLSALMTSYSTVNQQKQLDHTWRTVGHLGFWVANLVSMASLHMANHPPQVQVSDHMLLSSSFLANSRLALQFSELSTVAVKAVRHIRMDPKGLPCL